MLLLLVASALLVILGAAAMPAPYSWRTHSISESAAQAQHGAWIARLSFLAFGSAVLILSLRSHQRWKSAAYWWHLAFAACMLGTAAFSHKPWNPPGPGDTTEDILHSITATAMGFAFAVGVVFCLLRRQRGQVLSRSLDFVALVAATVLSPLGAAVPDMAGLLQRFMFLVAYVWYGHEAMALTHATVRDDA